VYEGCAMSGQEPDNDVTSKQPALDDEPVFPDLKLGDAWGESITKNRAAELEAMLQRWDAEEEHGERYGPFHGRPLDGADVFWLAARTWAGASEMEVVATFAEKIRLDELPPLDALHLEGAYLGQAHLKGACLNEAHLERAELNFAHLEYAKLSFAHLEGAILSFAHLEYAHLWGTHLEYAYLLGTHLERADLTRTHLERADLTRTHLDGAKMLWAFLDSATVLDNVVLGDEKLGYVSLVDVRCGDANLAVVEWTRTTRGFLRIRRRIDAIELGDEREARNAKDKDGKAKDKATRLQDYKDAVRANRQLATVLRQQGLNEDADRFGYKAQRLQREVLRRQRRYGAALGSWLLDMIAGYGYRPMRSLIAYIIIILAFAAAFLVNAQFAAPHLTWDEALVLSISSFHGRGFFNNSISLGDTLARLAAGEAIIGLLIEITFIATFTQRFFAR
jgi:hypothetical protein